MTALNGFRVFLPNLGAIRRRSFSWIVVSILTTGVATATIGDIKAFLQKCPSSDPAFAQISRDFTILHNGLPTPAPVCSEPLSEMPYAQITDELVVMESLRVAYYMDRGQSGHLPWTSGSLYDWLKSKIGGIDILDEHPVAASCCENFGGRPFIIIRRHSVQAPIGWLYMAGSISVYAHEARHVDGFPHTCTCVDHMCDPVFDVANLSAIGVQWWLEKLWLNGDINVGFACSTADIHSITQSHLDRVNGLRLDFCANAPPVLARPAAPGGICVGSFTQVASFIYAPSAVHVGDSVQFTDTSPNNPTTWTWDFGDSISPFHGSARQNPAHTFLAPGTYIVTLRIDNVFGAGVVSRSIDVVSGCFQCPTLRLIPSHPFDITVSATDPRTGVTSQGLVLAQNDIYGTFSVPGITGNAGNPEVIVKMVDASVIGQSYWVFFGALTDLHYTLAVRDTATGKTKTYNDERIGSTVCGQFDTSGFGSPATTTNILGHASGSSENSGDSLRLIGSHPFVVTLSASDPRTGKTGAGQLIAQTDIYGIFSIPDITGNSANPEIIIKMVDASGIGQNYWVFYSALTDLNYALSVREEATGRTKTYNDAKVGNTVCGQFDTSGFAQLPAPSGN